MAFRQEGPCWWPDSIPRANVKVRRKATPQSCPLTSTHVAWHKQSHTMIETDRQTHMPHVQKITINKLRDKNWTTWESPKHILISLHVFFLCLECPPPFRLTRTPFEYLQTWAQCYLAPVKTSSLHKLLLCALSTAPTSRHRRYYVPSHRLTHLFLFKTASRKSKNFISVYYPRHLLGAWSSH